MSSTESQIKSTGSAVWCNQDGLIAQVISDGLGLFENRGQEKFLTTIVHEEARAKTLDFLRSLREEDVAFDWELTVPLNGGQLQVLHFTGARVEDQFIVVAARSRAAMASVLEELVQTVDPQTCAPATLQALSVQARVQANLDADYYAEFTRLNNDLASAQRELAKKNAELAHLNDQKNQFLGIAAHDLRNPLDVILTYSGFVLNEAGEALSPEQVDFIQRIRTSSDFMLRLVNDLLDVSRIESGKLDLELEKVDLLNLIRENVARNQVLAVKKQIEITLGGDDSVPVVRVDVLKFEQVLNNLIGNAVKFSPSGTLVAVMVQDQEAEIVISVTDQGHGLDPNELDRLFRPFETGKRTARYEEKGTGLGLAICKRIVEGHGGRIWAENHDGGGARFSFSLPVNSTG